MVTRVGLLRHGETDSNSAGRLQGREGIKLNARGREQARQSAIFLASYRWDLIVSSPVIRALETAYIIAEHLAMEHILQMQEFEARGPGAAIGLTQQEIAARFPDGNVPGAEARPDVAKRSTKGLNALHQDHPGKRILVVTHREVIRNTVASLPGGETLAVAQPGIGSVSFIRYEGGGWQIESYNTMSHLTADQLG
ncbi:MAG: histidine phosphatase family protein [Chloroflexota bacterium]|nr:histidine phosphatase family protein [Chloroflexota bacterium]